MSAMKSRVTPKSRWGRKMAWLFPSLGAALSLQAGSFGDFYQVTEIKGPSGVDYQIGALEALPDGRLAAAFHQGQVGIYDPKADSWKIFAEGLQEPLGLLADGATSFLVMQRTELTRIQDETGDGIADTYATVWDDFGVTGNYHEYAFGPTRGPDGKLYIALNAASNAASIFEEIRGRWHEIGLGREFFYKDWKKNSSKAGRMFCRVPWRGWVLQIDPNTWQATPWACGFRSPDGVGFDAEGRLLVSDNQGDWRGTSELHVVVKDGFYGHPASLIWRNGWEKNPLDLPTAELDALRTPAAVWFPHAIYAASPTGMVVLPKSPAWGPFGGHTLIGEMNAARVLRLRLETVGGVTQGACFPFLEDESLYRGLHRLVMLGDKLILGRTHLAWAGGEGIGVVTPRGNVPPSPLDAKILPHGFQLSFTEPLREETAIDPKNWLIERYTYAYHSDYGSPQLEKNPVVPLSISLDTTKTTATLTLPPLVANFVYDFNFSRLEFASGAKMLHGRCAYTVRKIPVQ